MMYRNMSDEWGCHKCGAPLLAMNIGHFDTSSNPAGHIIRNGYSTHYFCHECYKLYCTFTKENFKLNRADFLFYSENTLRSLYKNRDACNPEDLWYLSFSKPNGTCSSCLKSKRFKYIMPYNDKTDTYLALCDDCRKTILIGQEALLENWLNEADTGTTTETGEVSTETLPE